MSDFVPGLEGVVAFETEIAEPDKEGGSLRYRGVDIEDLVGHVVLRQRVGPAGRRRSSTRACRPPSRSRSRCTPVTSGSTCSRRWRCSPRCGASSRCSTSTTTQARDDLARAAVMALSYVAQSARGQGLPMVPQREIDKAQTVVERFMIRWRGEPDPKHVAGGRRLLDVGRRARHERVDVHRPGHRLDRRGRRRRAVRRGRRDVRPAARRRALPRARHDRGDRADRRRGGLREARARPGRAADGLRPPRLPRRGPARPRAAAHRPRAGRPALRGRRGAGEGGARRAARPPPGPGPGDERRVLGRDHAGLRRGARAHVHLDVHLRPHGRLVGATSWSRSGPAAWSGPRPATSARAPRSSRTSRASRTSRH